uniref:AB hydrolase-1 domain-containing protein n=1 Tax=Macrostomum lignano TaxID=282301 RepID=A0A1I8I2D9_9PLAT
RLAFAPRSRPPLGRRSSPALLEAPPEVLAWTLVGQDWPEGGVDYHRTVAAPVMLMHGCEDRLVSAEDEEWMLETLPLARLVRVPNAGHLVTLEAPETVNAHLDQFLGSVRPVGHGRVPPLPPPIFATGEIRHSQRRQQRRRERRGSQERSDPSLSQTAPIGTAIASEGVDNPALQL